MLYVSKDLFSHQLISSISVLYKATTLTQMEKNPQAC